MKVYNRIYKGPVDQAITDDYVPVSDYNKSFNERVRVSDMRLAVSPGNFKFFNQHLADARGFKVHFEPLLFFDHVSASVAPPNQRQQHQRQQHRRPQPPQPVPLASSMR